MRNVKFVLLLAFVASLAWTGCKKGDTGPAGATGPAGPDSVVYSSWIPLAFNYVVTDSLYEDSVTATSLTQDILDSGIVLTYVNLGSSTESHIVPTAQAADFGISVGEEFEKGLIVLLANDDYSTLPYRYVTIPGSKMEGNSTQRKYNGYTSAELKSMSYDKVKAIAAGSN